MYPSLQAFVAALDHAGELHRVTAPVTPRLEIAEIAHRLAAHGTAPTTGITGSRTDPTRPDRGGPALLFENVEGADPDIRLAINLFGSYHRMEMALGCHAGSRGQAGHTPEGFAGIGARIASIVEPKPPTGLRDLVAKAREFAPLLRIPPRIVRRGPCQEIVETGDAIDLFRLPIIKCWPLDGDVEGVGYPVPADQPDIAAGDGRYVTLAGMYTIHADDAGKAKPPSRNIGMYRAQLLDRRRLAMHWHVHHDGAAHWRSWKRRGEPMPIAIVLGGPSVMPYAATAPLPPGISEILLAGFLNRGGIPLVPCRTVPLQVPAEAEIVIEGFVSTECGPIGYDPRLTDEPLGPGAVFEGPFGDHTGFYSLPDRYPIVDVTALTRRRNAIYPTTVVGPPPQEDYYLGKATERIFLPLLKTLVHDIEDYDLPLFGCFHNCAAIRIRKAYPLQARRVMHAIWGAGQMAWTKILFIVDETVDVHDLDAVLAAVAEHVHFRRDVEVVNGPLDILDHASPRLGAGHKVGFDATRRMPGEEVDAVAVDVDLAPSVDVARSRDVLRAAPGVRAAEVPPWSRGRVGLVAFDAEVVGSNAARDRLRALLADADHGCDLLIATGPEADPHHRDEFLFHWAANADPGRDALRHDHRLAFDATMKRPHEIPETGQPVRPYPPFNRMPDEIIDRVTRRWSEYGFTGPAPAPRTF